MVGLHMLWLPILLSSVFVFIVSSLIHMASPWHKNDYPKIPNEDKVLDTVRALSIPPGEYMAPRPSSRKEMRSPEFIEKRNKGPVFMITIWPAGQVSMVKGLILWFFYNIVVSIFAAYITGRALTIGTPFLWSFRFAGATAFVGYTLALWQMSIWYNRPWGTSIKLTVDGLIYGLLTGIVFGWLWPQ